MAFAYEYPRPALAVDCVVFGLGEQDLKVLLIRRGSQPFKNKWALPGGFVNMDESLDLAARRELQEESGITDVYLEQLFTFGQPDRDPRDRVVSVAYYALVKLTDHSVRSASDAAEAAWFATRRLPPLAFDHDHIVAAAVQRLRGKVRYQPVGFELLPPKFTLSQIQHLYETILERPLDKRNFRRKILSMDLLVELKELQKDVAHRAARMYRFNRRKYEQLTKRGFNFEI